MRCSVSRRLVVLSSSQSSGPYRVFKSLAAQAIRRTVDVELLGAADQQPGDLNLIPVLRHLLDRRESGKRMDYGRRSLR